MNPSEPRTPREQRLIDHIREERAKNKALKEELDMLRAELEQAKSGQEPNPLLIVEVIQLRADAEQWRQQASSTNRHLAEAQALLANTSKKLQEARANLTRTTLERDEAKRDAPGYNAKTIARLRGERDEARNALDRILGINHV